MSGIGGFRGVSASQDARFVKYYPPDMLQLVYVCASACGSKQKRMLKTKKFPKELDVVVDYSRVNWAVMREWTAKRVTELLGIEDEVLIQFIHNRLEEVHDLNPKELYLELMPFLEKNTGLFMKELWTLLASAAASDTGIPQQILDAKAEELRKQMEKQSTIIESIEEQRKKAKIEIESMQLESSMAEANKEPPQKKEKSKRWAPPPRTDPPPEAISLPRNRERVSGFSGGVEHRRRNQRERWRDRVYSPPQKRRRSPKRRPSPKARSPKRSLHKRRPHRRPHERARSQDRSLSWERGRERNSRSPKPQLHHRERKQRMENRGRKPSPAHTLSRSPPQSRHASPPPPNYNLSLARKRQPHDRKARSIELHISSRSPPTKSPSPRSRNRMSSTPDLREGAPSPSSLPSQKEALSTPSPTPKPLTPQTRTPPARYEQECESDRKTTRGLRPFGSMYAFPDEDDTFCDRPRRSSRRSPPPVSRHRHTSDFNRSRPRAEGRGRRDNHHRGYERSPHGYQAPSEEGRKGRRGYSYRSSTSPQKNQQPSTTRKEKITTSESRERGDAMITRTESESEGTRDYRQTLKQEHKTEKRQHPMIEDGSVSDQERSRASLSTAEASQESEEQSKTKEKLKRKLDEILEKKDSLNLD